MFAAVTVFTSCNKDQKISKQLDGEWNATMVDDKAVTAGDVVAKFVPDADGKGTITVTIKGLVSPMSGTYAIKDEKITSVIGNETETSTITEHSSKVFKTTADDGKKSEWAKK